MLLGPQLHLLSSTRVFLWQIHYRKTKYVSEIIVRRKRRNNTQNCSVCFVFHPNTNTNRVSGNDGRAVLVPTIVLMNLKIMRYLIVTTKFISITWSTSLMQNHKCKKYELTHHYVSAQRVVAPSVGVSSLVTVANSSFNRLTNKHVGRLVLTLILVMSEILFSIFAFMILHH